MLESFKIAAALKAKQISLNKMLNFIEGLGPAFNLDDAIDVMNERKEACKEPAPLEPELSSEEILKIEARLKAQAAKDLLEEVSRLRQARGFRGTYSFNNPDGSEFESKVYDSVAWIENLSPMLRSIAKSFGKKITYRDKDIHPTMTIDLTFTPDSLIENVQLPECEIKKEVGFKHNYTETKEDGKPYFRRLTQVNLKCESLYLKNVTFLQIFSIFGLDDLIDKAVIYGADIDYKEQSTGKTAKEFYRPASNVPPHYTAYIKSLLDGTFEDGKYKAIYEKKKLEQHLGSEVPLEESSLRINKI